MAEKVTTGDLGCHFPGDPVRQPGCRQRSRRLRFGDAQALVPVASGSIDQLEQRPFIIGADEHSEATGRPPGTEDAALPRVLDAEVTEAPPAVSSRSRFTCLNAFAASRIPHAAQYSAFTSAISRRSSLPFNWPSAARVCSNWAASAMQARDPRRGSAGCAINSVTVGSTIVRKKVTAWSSEGLSTRHLLRAEPAATICHAGEGSYRTRSQHVAQGHRDHGTVNVGKAAEIPTQARSL